MRYNHFTMLPERAFKSLGGKMTLEGGDSQPAPQPTTSTSYNTNIPEYAKPYVTNMLEATQRQLFNVDSGGGISGFKEYKPYSSNVNDYFAGFSPMQQQAQRAAANLQTPGQYQQASGLAGTSGIGSIMAGQQYGQQAIDPNAVGSYMNPYLRNTLDPALQLLNQQYGIAGQQQQGAATRGGAFGGNREILANSLNQQNQMLAQNQLVGNAYNQAYDVANRNMQAAAAQALQGYGQANTAAGTLANIGGQDLAAQQNIINMQNTMGAQQQALEQNKINQAIQNYATQQQYPMMQLGMMSNMLRGLPMQSTTTQSYQATPSTAQQLIGAAGTLGSTYQALAKPVKEGGVIKGLAHGGSVKSYAVGGEVKQQLSMMSDDQLQRVAQTSPSNEIRAMAAQILAEHKMAEQITKNPEAAQGLMAASTGDTFNNMADGGIVAFAEGSKDAVANPEENYQWNPVTRRNEPVQGETVTPMSDATMAGLAAIPAEKPANVASTDLNTIIRGLQQSRAEAGVGGKPRQAEREMIEKRLAGLDEQERQQNWLKAAEFFARLGTTPGGVLKGGLEAAKETMPELAKLRADQIKIRENYANIQANIDEADRLERMGLVKDAEAIRERTIKEEGENRRADAANRRALEVANIQAAANIRGHEISANAALRNAAIRTAREKIDDRAYNAIIQNVAKELNLPAGDPKVLEEAYLRFSGAKGLAGPKIETTAANAYTQRLSEAYAKDKNLNNWEMQLGLMKPDSPKYAALDKKVRDRKAEIKQRIDDAFVRENNPFAPKSARPSNEPGIGADKASNRPPLSSFGG